MILMNKQSLFKENKIISLHLIHRNDNSSCTTISKKELLTLEGQQIIHMKCYKQTEDIKMAQV